MHGPFIDNDWTNHLVIDVGALSQKKKKSKEKKKGKKTSGGPSPQGGMAVYIYNFKQILKL